MKQGARIVQGTVALGGLILMVLALTALLGSTGPVSPWLVRFFVIWAVGVPYWWFLEHQFIIRRLSPSPEREGLIYLQHLSFRVWLGFVLCVGFLIVARGVG